MPGFVSQRMWKLSSRIFISLELFGLGGAVTAYLDGVISSRTAIAIFEQVVAAENREEGQQDREADLLHFQLAEFAPDQSLWSDDARARYENVRHNDGSPIALLKIGRLNLKAPVFLGTDRFTLNRGIGVVDNTAFPGEVGNVALSAHRDSFFRPLKDIVIGDKIELQTLQGIQHFQVSDISIVDPTDISVLESSDTSILTLITCYPFYFVGFAPDRYIVRASLVSL